MTQRKSHLAVVLGWRRLIVRATVAAAIAAVVVSLLLPRWYMAHATIAPPEESTPGGDILQLMNQFGSGLGVGRARSLMNRTAASDLVLGVLKSRRIRGQVVDRFGLAKAGDVKSRERAIKKIGDHLDVGVTPEGFIDIGVEARSAQAAADQANAFVEFLDQYNRSTSVEDARRTREFIGKCLDENRERMDKASAALREFQEKRGAIELGEQTRATVDALADLEAERMQLEIQNGVLQNYAMPNQVQVQEIEAKIREIDGKLRELREKSAPKQGAKGAGSALLALGDLPALALEYEDLKREVLAREKVYEFLTAQYEDARIRETRDMRTVKVLDEATPPLRRTRPRRSLIVLLTAALALALSIAVSTVAEALAAFGPSGDAGTDPWVARLQRAALRLRRWGGPIEPPS